eukprot:Skav208980  [mRNA]  locus=scaffold1270:113793:126943:- [translate_table: standard]
MPCQSQEWRPNAKGNLAPQLSSLVQLQTLGMGQRKVVWNHGVPEAIIEERLGKQLGKGTASDDKACILQDIRQGLSPLHSAGCGAMGQGSGKDAVLTAELLPGKSTVNGGSWHPVLNCGLCASGGGSRAFSFTMGVYRALHDMQLLPHLDVISSVSGGTWVSSIFMFAQSFKGKPISTGELLGPATKPSELSMAFLQKEVAPIASGIVQGDSDKIIVELLAT